MCLSCQLEGSRLNMYGRLLLLRLFRRMKHNVMTSCSLFCLPDTRTRPEHNLTSQHLRVDVSEPGPHCKSGRLSADRYSCNLRWFRRVLLTVFVLKRAVFAGGVTPGHWQGTGRVFAVCPPTVLTLMLLDFPRQCCSQLPLSMC